MGILADWQLRELGVVTPHEPGRKRPGLISYGADSYGYSLRLGRRFKVFDAAGGGVVDPKKIDENLFVDVEGDSCLVPANGFALAESVEWVRVPEDCLGLCVEKSTYRRCGILMGATVLEPAWEGRVTLEITNSAPLPAKVYAGEGVCQLLVFRAETLCEINYAQKAGRYQGQAGLTLPSVD